MNKLVERRLEFLNMEGMGFSLCEIVKVLSKKYHKTERSIYYDAETRKTWQPLFTQLFDLDKARLVVVNRYETIYRKAAFMVLQGDNSEKATGLKIMLDVNRSLAKLLGVDVPEEKPVELTIEDKRMMDKLSQVLNPKVNV